jgi:hypothetical protein
MLPPSRFGPWRSDLSPLPSTGPCGPAADRRLSVAVIERRVGEIGVLLRAAKTFSEREYYRGRIHGLLEALGDRT